MSGAKMVALVCFHKLQGHDNRSKFPITHAVITLRLSPKAFSVASHVITSFSLSGFIHKTSTGSMSIDYVYV